jgi:hypothetical protein
VVIDFPHNLMRFWARCRHCGSKQKLSHLSARGWCFDCEEDADPERRRQLDEEFIASLRAQGASEEFLLQQMRALALTSGVPPKRCPLPHALRAQYLRMRLARPELFAPR